MHDVAELLRPYPSEGLRACRVSTAVNAVNTVNNVKNDGPPWRGRDGLAAVGPDCRCAEVWGAEEIGMLPRYGEPRDVSMGECNRGTPDLRADSP